MESVTFGPCFDPGHSSTVDEEGLLRTPLENSTVILGQCHSYKERVPYSPRAANRSVSKTKNDGSKTEVSGMQVPAERSTLLRTRGECPKSETDHDRAGMGSSQEPTVC